MYNHSSLYERNKIFSCFRNHFFLYRILLFKSSISEKYFHSQQRQYEGLCKSNPCNRRNSIYRIGNIFNNKSHFEHLIKGNQYYKWMYCLNNHIDSYFLHSFNFNTIKESGGSMLSWVGSSPKFRYALIISSGFCTIALR